MSLKALHQRALSIAKTNTRTVKDYQKGYVQAYREVAAAISKDIMPSAIARTKQRIDKQSAINLGILILVAFLSALIAFGLGGVFATMRGYI
jgi:hypothetical protein